MFRIFFIIAFAFINTAHANVKLNLGSTFDSMSKHSTVISSCIKPELLENNFDIINYSSSLNFEYTKMIEQIQKSMGIDINTTLNIGPFTKSMDYHYGLTSIEDDFSLKINYFYLYSGELIFRDISKFNAFSSLTNEAQKIYLIDKRRFRELCGDGYISSLYANAGLILTFSLQFNSKIEKQYYENQFVATKDLQNILSIIKHHSDNSTFNVDAQGIQIGGNRKLFEDLFIHNGGIINDYGYPEIHCGNNKFISDICANLIDEIIEYATSLKNQINSIDDFHLTNHNFSSYSDFLIDISGITPEKEVLSAMTDLMNKYIEDYNDNKFIQLYYEMLKSKGMLSSLLESDLQLLKYKYSTLINQYETNNLELCFIGFVTSVTCLPYYKRFDNIRTIILNDNKLTKLLNYLKTHQFSADLYYTNGLDKTMQCMFSPISNQEQGLYMINCNNKIFGSFEYNKAIKMNFVAEDSINLINLHYQIDNIVFDYTFQKPLKIMQVMSNIYMQKSIVKVVNNNSIPNTLVVDFRLTKN